jgi:hypothetical protein
VPLGEAMKRHRWGDKVLITPNKSECECRNGCGIVKASRNESEGGRPIYWTEYWRGLDRIAIDHAPVCEMVMTELERGEV